MTEAEIQAEIVVFETAIRNVALLGQSYIIGTGASARTFTAADLVELRKYVTDLKGQLAASQGTSGIVLGF